VAEAELIPAHQHPQSRMAQIDATAALDSHFEGLETA
jgi:hypothetical protein